MADIEGGIEGIDAVVKDTEDALSEDKKGETEKGEPKEPKEAKKGRESTDADADTPDQKVESGELGLSETYKKSLEKGKMMAYNMFSGEEDISELSEAFNNDGILKVSKKTMFKRLGVRIGLTLAGLDTLLAGMGELMKQMPSEDAQKGGKCLIDIAGTIKVILKIYTKLSQLGADASSTIETAPEKIKNILSAMMKITGSIDFTGLGKFDPVFEKSLRGAINSKAGAINKFREMIDSALSYDSVIKMINNTISVDMSVKGVSYKTEVMKIINKDPKLKAKMDLLPPEILTGRVDGVNKYIKKMINDIFSQISLKVPTGILSAQNTAGVDKEVMSVLKNLITQMDLLKGQLPDCKAKLKGAGDFKSVGIGLIKKEQPELAELYKDALAFNPNINPNNPVVKKASLKKGINVVKSVIVSARTGKVPIKNGINEQQTIPKRQPRIPTKLDEKASLSHPK